jgi:hypothetical protein
MKNQWAEPDPARPSDRGFVLDRRTNRPNRTTNGFRITGFVLDRRTSRPQLTSPTPGGLRTPVGFVDELWTTPSETAPIRETRG